jgi:hypothetical protein
MGKKLYSALCTYDRRVKGRGPEKDLWKLGIIDNPVKSIGCLDVFQDEDIRSFKDIFSSMGDGVL